MDELGRLKRVDPRSVWMHEAHDFTPWLLTNKDALAEVLGIDLELTSAEYPVGGFALDLIGRDLTNDCVLIVENQLAGTDHTHLGQILTYAAGTDAATIVWMATAFREEHRQALDWLNGLAGSNARFFGVEIGLARIGSSPPAPLFTLAAQPNDWHAHLAAAAKVESGGSGKGELYRQFWTKFLDRVHAERPLWTRARVPQNVNWMIMPCPVKGASLGVNFTGDGRIRTELYIDNGDRALNTAIFQALQTYRAKIEAAVGEMLSWEDMPTRQASRIAMYRPGQVTDTTQADSYIDWFLDTGTRLRAALTPEVVAAAAAAQPAEPLSD
ncbi:DUF4268 domain-containing protein [Actinoallomurus soli]|uniref:DUF4268 domain-containing protein n=1 Tax=Actinoallomurus soli TaxID=2952535 RepID=UPI0020927229|nr:DUF4268 domain-containing protein [Actinoallomurus soli]MCO5971268.1 DUF4268 domain-containing protein [Actinoallomurus soli]